MNQIRHTRLAALAATLALSAACGGGGSSTDPTDGTTSDTGGSVGPETAALFCDQMYTSFVDRYASCLKAPVAYVAHNVDKAKLCALPVAAVAAGHATYDQAAAGRCLDFQAAATCTELQAIRDETIDVPDCRAAVQGNLAFDAACVSDAECSSGPCGASQANYCSATCFFGRAIGSACTSDRDCAAGTFCSGVYPTATCQPQTNRPGEDESCLNEACLPGYYCTAYPDYLCKKKLESGACTSGRQAAPGFDCASGVIKPFVAMGEACASSFDCGPGAFCAYSAAAGVDVCSQLPVVGQKCVQARGAWQCLGGTCNVVTLTDANCVEYYPDACSTDWDCESKGYCSAGCQAFCVTP